jgi:hypothetical protein
VSGFLTSLRPVWWVLRAWILVAAVFVVALHAGWSHRMPLVPVLWSGEGGLLVVLAVAVVSVLVGRRAWGRRTARVLLWVNAVLALAALPVLASVAASTERNITSAVEVRYYPQPLRHGFSSSGGVPVLNVYPYDANGHLLTDVRLYDDRGLPVDLGLGYDPNRRAVFDRTGQLATNAFPLRYFEPGTRVVANPSAGPQVVVPPLVPQPMTASATPQANATPTASATP